MEHILHIKHLLQRIKPCISSLSIAEADKFLSENKGKHAAVEGIRDHTASSPNIPQPRLYRLKPSIRLTPQVLYRYLQ